jgi:hypothetical protein
VVGKGDLLQAKITKVLPTNEFFNLADSDWESASPKSIIGHLLKPLSDEERSAFQKQIDEALGREPSANCWRSQVDRFSWHWVLFSQPRDILQTPVPQYKREEGGELCVINNPGRHWFPQIGNFIKEESPSLAVSSF